MPKGLELNKAWWNERAELHGADGFYYDTAAFLAGELAVSARELSELRKASADLSGVELLHLQCHLGLGTLSFARLGADVTGLDFSGSALAKARAVADAAGLDADFVEADVHRLPEALAGRFDIVFASYGVLVWAWDLDAWMTSAATALRPGGHLVLVEGHPMLTMVESVDPPQLRWRYQGGEPVYQRYPGSYAAPDANTVSEEVVMFLHGVGEVTTAAVRAGLEIESLTEWTDAEAAPDGGNLTRRDDGHHRLPFAGADLPVEYSLIARLPDSH